MFLISLLLASGCSKEKNDSTPTLDDTSLPLETADQQDETYECPGMEAQVEWSTEMLILQISTPVPTGSYYFGMAETVGPVENLWTGEDCFSGFTSPSGELYLYCHPAGSGDQAGLLLLYGANYTTLVEGHETHFPNSSYATEVTYTLRDSINHCCWVWGDSPQYYEDLGCTVLAQSQDSR